MELPNPCKEALAALTAHADLAAMKKAAARMTGRYREESGRGTRLVTGETEVLTYAAVRMPATFCAVRTALRASLAALPEGEDSAIQTVLDLGSGTGAGLWAAADLLPSVHSFVCTEREPEMIRIGQALSADAGFPFSAEWIQKDACQQAEAFAKEGRTFDLVMASYMTNEMTGQERARLLRALFRITGKLLLLTEPGTPTGYRILREAAEQLRPSGAEIAAPCPRIAECPLAEDDWCHFTCRAARSRLHKLLKGGDVPYEDEKFSYLCFAKIPVQPCEARILRHPIIEPGKITLTLCTPEGWQKISISKREKALFSAARKASCGEIFKK